MFQQEFFYCGCSFFRKCNIIIIRSPVITITFYLKFKGFVQIFIFPAKAVELYRSFLVQVMPVKRKVNRKGFFGLGKNGNGEDQEKHPEKMVAHGCLLWVVKWQVLQPITTDPSLFSCIIVYPAAVLTYLCDLKKYST